MKRNKLKTFEASRSLTLGIMTGSIAALLLSVLLTTLMTNLVLSGSLSEKSVSVVIFLNRMISVLVGSLIGGAVTKQKFLIQVGGTALAYLIVLLGIGIVFYDESFKHFLSGVISVFAGGAVALVILQRPKDKTHKSKKYSL